MSDEFQDKLSAILGDQQAMSQIMALAQSLGGSNEPVREPEQGQEQEPLPASAPPPAMDPGALLGSVDPKLLQMGMRLMGEYQRSDDRNTALLAALRPFLREERAEKMDRAVQIARLSRVVRVLMDSWKENGGVFRV